MKRIVSAALVSLVLAQVPIYSAKPDIYDHLRRFSNSPYCQGLFNHKRWYTDLFAYLTWC